MAATITALSFCGHRGSFVAIPEKPTLRKAVSVATKTRPKFPFRTTQRPELSPWPSRTRSRMRRGGILSACSFCQYFSGPDHWPDTARVSCCNLHRVSLAIELTDAGYKNMEWFCRDFTDTGRAYPPAVAHFNDIRQQLESGTLYRFYGEDAPSLERSPAKRSGLSSVALQVTPRQTRSRSLQEQPKDSCRLFVPLFSLCLLFFLG